MKVVTANRCREEDRKRRQAIRSQIKVVIDDKPKVSKKRKTTQDDNKGVDKKKEIKQPVEETVKKLRNLVKITTNIRTVKTSCTETCASELAFKRTQHPQHPKHPHTFIIWLRPTKTLPKNCGVTVFTFYLSKEELPLEAPVRVTGEITEFCNITSICRVPFTEASRTPTVTNAAPYW